MARVIYGAALIFGLMAFSVVSITRLTQEKTVVASQVNSELDRMDSLQSHEIRPDEESWLVIDQVYQVWLNHGEFSENDQLKKVILTLTQRDYKVNSMTVTSYVARARRIDGTPLFLNDQMPNTVVFFVSK